MSDHARGLVVTATGVVLLSPDALLLRLVTVDPWTVLFWRGLGIFAVLGLLTLWRDGTGALRLFRKGLPLGLVIPVAFAICQSGFVNAIALTNAANVLVIISATPLFAALFSRVLLGERLARRTAIAIGCGMLGVIVTVSGGLRGGIVIGDLIALVVPLSIALAFTVTRLLRIENAWPYYALSGPITALMAWPSAAPLAPAGLDVLWIALIVLIVSPLSFALISIGPRHLPSAEVSLLLLLETVLGPLWVWLGVGEAPTARAFIGGAILLATLIWHSLASLRRERRPPEVALTPAPHPDRAR